MKLPKDFIDINLAFSRVPGKTKAVRAGPDPRARRGRGAAARRRELLHLHLRAEGMETGVAEAFHEVCRQHAMDWETLLPSLREEVGTTSKRTDRSGMSAFETTRPDGPKRRRADAHDRVDAVCADDEDRSRRSAKRVERQSEFESWRRPSRTAARSSRRSSSRPIAQKPFPSMSTAVSR